MSDPTRAKDQFLACFPAQYRDHIIDFAKRISKLEVDVLMFTARKAVCLFNCLEAFGVYSPARKIVISERWMDHDRSWLRGKSVAIVDEVIVTGTSIYNLHADLVGQDVKRVEVHCLFVNSTYFVKDLFADIDLIPGYICLKVEEAQTLSTAIVEAMYQVPRPYSVDYPMSAWSEIAHRSIPRLISVPSWETVERHWMGKRTHGGGRRTTYFRVIPRPEIYGELDKAIGANVCSPSLIKLRLYGASTGEGAEGRFHFRVVPYVVLGELPASEVGRIFASLIAPLALDDQETTIRNCNTDDARLRFVQYVFASRLAQYWSDALRDHGLPVGFRQDSTELNYIFPEVLHGSINRLSQQSKEQLEIRWPSVPVVKTARNARLSALPFYYQLAKPFDDLYVQKELPLRELALKLGRKLFQSNEYRKLRDRLKDGHSLEQLRAVATRIGIPDCDSALSDFIDLGVDSGIVVPITARRRVGREVFLYRAYRHGEETYILRRDLTYFNVMLHSFERAWRRMSGASSGHKLPRVLVEKVLVLFYRFSLSSDFIRTTYERLDELKGDVIPLNIGFHKHGARLSTSTHDPTVFPSDKAFVDLLLAEGILVKDKGGGYGVGSKWIDQPLDKKRKAAASRFSSVLANAVSLPSELLEPNELGQPAKVRDRMLVALTSCDTGTNTLIAVGAELRLFCAYFSGGFALPVRKREGLLRHLEARDARFYVGNAMSKIFSHLDRVATRASERIAAAFGEDSVEGAVWLEIWDSISSIRSVEEEREANQQLHECLCTIWRIDMHILFLRAFLATEAGKDVNAIETDIDESLDRIERRAERLQGKIKPRSSGSRGAYSAFSELAREIADQCRKDLTAYRRSKWSDRFQARRVSEQLNVEYATAISLFHRIDARYRERNSITETDRFTSAVAIRFANTGCDSATFNAMMDAVRRDIVSQISAAHVASKRQRRARPEVIELRLVERSDGADVRLYARGDESAYWLGSIVGSVLTKVEPASMHVHPAWICISGLDESRAYTRSRDTDTFDSYPLVESLVLGELAATCAQGVLIASGTPEVQRRSSEQFHDGYSRSAKGAAGLRSIEANVPLDALDDRATTAKYEWNPKAAAILLSAAGNAGKASFLVMATEWAPYHGGISSFNQRLCECLVRAGARVVCVVQSATDSERADAKKRDVVLLVPNKPPGADADSLLYQAFSLPVGFVPTAIVGHGRISGPAAFSQQTDRFPKARRLHFVHMSPGEIEPLKRSAGAAARSDQREQTEQELARSAALVVAVGRKLHQEFESIFAAIGVQMHLFEPGPDMNALATPVALNKCLMLGRADDVESKGIDIAARAVSRAAGSAAFSAIETKPRLLVRGAPENTGDDLRSQLQALCGHDGLTAIDVREFRADEAVVQESMRGSSLLLMPSRSEGFGLVALEAVSIGLPVLVSANSGFAWLVKDHAPEFADEVIVNMGMNTASVEVDVTAWSERLTRVLIGKRLAFERAALLRAQLAKSVSWDRATQKLLAAFGFEPA